MIFVVHGVSYFLLDDFIIVGKVTSRSVWQLLSEPLFNFYRPVADLWLKALFAVFGWDHPAGYIVMSMALHAACALFVRALACLCGLASTGVERRRIALSLLAVAVGSVLPRRGGRSEGAGEEDRRARPGTGRSGDRLTANGKP
jgi:hypothetical protein